MSEIGLNINVDSYNNEGIKTIKGNNNAEIYKLYILKNKRRLSLVGKTVKLGYVMVGTTNGDVIENLNITNAEQGEITFPITNRISKKDGVYSCQLAIYGADGFLEHTATFGLTVEANIFTKIAGEIADSKDFTYLENILDKASKLSEKLKENTSSATNANSNLESNITEANNINSKLLENTSTATSLNKNLESNIDLAKEVKETIKDLDTKNTEATSNIGQLTDLNNKAQELSNNINQALPLNSELVKNTEEAKVANTNLAATNQEATFKNTELQASLEKTKEFINGLDGSQNIPQLRLDITELQNGLKSNQALAYTGSSISAENTLEGRTEGMRIGGRTLQNLWNGKIGNNITNKIKGETTYTIIITNCSKNTSQLNGKWIGSSSGEDFLIKPKGNQETYYIVRRVSPSNANNLSFYFLEGGEDTQLKILILEDDWINKPIPKYFEGIKSFGEAEGNKISILSSGKNRVNPHDFIETEFVIKFGNGLKNTKISALSNQIIYKKIIKGGSTISYKRKSLGVENESSALLQFKFFDDTVMYTTVQKDRYDIPKDVKEIQFLNYCRGTHELTDFQIEEGSIVSPAYQPYQSFKKDILIKEPLRSKDDICDLLYEDNGQVKIDRYIGVRKYQEGDERNKDVLTDKINTVYILDKPVTEIVENCVDIDLDTFGEKTYFNILNSLPGTLDFKVPSNIASIVQNTAREVNNIWDVINNLLVPSLIDINKNVAMSTIKNNLK